MGIGYITPFFNNRTAKTYILFYHILLYIFWSRNTLCYCVNGVLDKIYQKRI